MATEIRHTGTQVNDYYRKIKKLVIEPLQKDIVKRLAETPEIASAWQNQINKAFNDVEYVNRVDTGSPVIASNHINGLSDWHQKKMGTQFNELFGIDVIPLLNDQNTQTLLSPIISTNIDLIKSISPELLSQVNDEYSKILQTKGFDTSAVLRMLTDRFSVSDSRAQLIAEDQTGKTIGALTSVRQQQVKVTKFMWRTSEDERVRPSHAVLDGKIFNWATPPAIGIPGEPIRCRCVAIPVLPQFE